MLEALDVCLDKVNGVLPVCYVGTGPWAQVKNEGHEECPKEKVKELGKGFSFHFDELLTNLLGVPDPEFWHCAS